MLKRFYRKEVVHHILKTIEEATSNEINILIGMRFDKKAWYSVTRKTVAKFLRNVFGLEILKKIARKWKYVEKKRKSHNIRSNTFLVIQHIIF